MGPHLRDGEPDKRHYEGDALMDLPTLILLVQLSTALATLVGIVWNTVKLNRTASNVQKIETATNSMKDALVLATATGEFAKGKTEGRNEIKAEQGAAAAAVQANKEKS